MPNTAIDTVLWALRRNRVDAEYLPSGQELLARLETLIPQGCITASGSSETLTQFGVRDFLRRRTQYYDAGTSGNSCEARDRIIRKGFEADVYLTSVAAVTEKGELLLVDGTGNRTAAMAYGPKRVIVIVGTNKLVSDLDAAIVRLQTVAAPQNAIRRDKKELPCARTGQCVDCKAPSRMCCDFLRVAFCREKGRITVLLVGEDAGF